MLIYVCCLSVVLCHRRWLFVSIFFIGQDWPIDCSLQLLAAKLLLFLRYARILAKIARESGFCRGIGKNALMEIARTGHWSAEYRSGQDYSADFSSR